MPPPERVAATLALRDRRVLRVSIIGAESTGKSRLAQSLVDRLEGDFGLHAVCVGEYLREWCDTHARTPRADEQAAIALEQERRIDDAASRGDVDLVIADTTPLMTAVYSELLFGDRSIDEQARDCQRRMDATLLMALDLPWEPDGLQRDGPHVQAPVDALIRGRLSAWGIDWAVVNGSGAARTANAVDALCPLLREVARASAASTGIFSRLAHSEGGPQPLAWVCDRCDLPECEHPAARRAR